VSEPTVVDSSIGRVEVQFGINRWVLVTVDSDEAQEQIETVRGLVDYLQKRGLLESEAREIARAAWRARPRGANAHAASADESLVSAAGLSPGAAILILTVFVAALIVLAVYAATHLPG
jgi:hypothetical protein